ncbi:hypothetical protein PV10_03638 [Exophiala mesophila]|uniref:Uncharacterized protein n=1 Tax=Exophiala mesophila TaxID=212818 RepID=A0A0D1Y5Y5_EXOME|nr:uncharacterized protein PV10_03638 [Exophiala mesophila]KIV96056.1 hypothetical protein PV10_03638 [Exophiala mesophila]
MSSPANNFLTLIPAAHRVAVISPFTSNPSEDIIVPVLQKTRRSSSSATTDSNTAEEPSLPAEAEVVASPTESVDVQVTVTDVATEQIVPVQRVGLQTFLRLGN